MPTTWRRWPRSPRRSTRLRPRSATCSAPKSAMPHKRNPVTCEQISGLARVVRSNAQAGFENVALWHERDISHSSAERIIIPDSTTLADYLLNKTAALLETLFVYPDRMLANLESTHGLVFSGQLLLDLVESGISREDAYRLVQSHAPRACRQERCYTSKENTCTADEIALKNFYSPLSASRR